MEMHRRGAVAEAAARYSQVLSFDPKNVDALCLLGMAASQQKQFAQSVEVLRKAVKVAPRHAAAHNLLGAALKELGRAEEALKSFDRAISHQPDVMEPYVNRADLLMALNRPAEAVATYDRALAIRPDLAEAEFGRGIVFRDRCRLAEAVACFDRAIALNRNPAVRGLLHSHRAELLNLLGRFPEALADVQRCLEVAPDDDQALFAISLIELLHGRWSQAWPKYERRIALGVGVPPNYTAPPWRPWRGESPHGDLLVLRGEQGLGDHLLFSRFGAHLAKLGHRVALWTKPSLQPLLQTVPGVERVITDPAELHGIEDVRLVGMMSVPGILGTTPATVPQNVPFLAAEPERVAAWRERLGTHGFRIGIAWQNAGASYLDPLRSIPLREFAPLCEIPGVRLVSLQKGPGEEEVTAFEGRIETPGAPFDESGAFLDSAAVMMNLDLVVTSCTAIAHLAGALGRPTFVALMQVPEWRWLIDRDDSPWYPTARLFRQTTADDWAGVFARVTDAVRRLSPAS